MMLRIITSIVIVNGEILLIAPCVSASFWLLSVDEWVSVVVPFVGAGDKAAALLLLASISLILPNVNGGNCMSIDCLPRVPVTWMVAE